MQLISIQRPLSIDMEMVDTDTRLPSIKMAVKMEVVHPTGTIIYSANDIWFECSVWDEFVSNILNVSSGGRRDASLKNMSDFFVLNIGIDEGIKRLNFTSREVNAGEGVVSLNFESILDDDMLAAIIEQFTTFEKWW